MMNYKELQKKVNDFSRSVTDKFMELENISDVDAQKKERSNLFSKLIRFLGSINIEIQQLEKSNSKQTYIIENLKKEKNRLQALYKSGIMLGAEIEKEKMLKLALNIVVHEINADNGFIILTDKVGNIIEVISHLMEREADEETEKVCMSVISNTLKNMSVENKASDDEDSFIRKSSSIGFGLKDVLCIPLLSELKFLGVLYIDRKKTEQKFSETDLAFLISFSKQIVRSIIITTEISHLKDSIQNTTKQKLKDLRKEFDFKKIIGTSKKLYEVLRLISKIADTNINVFLLGENGTGKDLLANAIHNNSPRKGNSFVSINCGAIPNDLLESELFGYDQGAYTGAVKNKPGRLEMAEGGTVFLDEITEMPLTLQTKLLRVIQEKEIQRLGSVEIKKIDVRFIAATNKNIKELIKNGLFREDLYYRLKVLEITLPSLSERKEDIEELAEYFIKKHSSGGVYSLSYEAIDALEAYEWPGNVRELENIIQRCLALASGSVLSLDDLPPEIISVLKLENTNEVKTLNEAETEFRKDYIRKILRETKSKSEAAKILGINRSHFHKLISQLGI